MRDKRITRAHTARLARVLQAGRKTRKWTLREAAAETGISNGYLSLMEQGEVKAPSPRYLSILADKYGLPFEELMVLAGHPFGATDRSSVPNESSSGKLRGDISLQRGTPVFAYHEPGSSVQGGASPQVHDSPRSIGGEPHTGERLAAERGEAELSGLTEAEVAQVRAFIAGLKSGRRS